MFEDDSLVYVGPDRDIPRACLKFAMKSWTCPIPCFAFFINCHTHLGMVAFRTLGDDVADD